MKKRRLIIVLIIILLLLAISIIFRHEVYLVFGKPIIGMFYLLITFIRSVHTGVYWYSAFIIVVFSLYIYLIRMIINTSPAEKYNPDDYNDYIVGTKIKMQKKKVVPFEYYSERIVNALIMHYSSDPNLSDFEVKQKFINKEIELPEPLYAIVAGHNKRALSYRKNIVVRIFTYFSQKKAKAASDRVHNDMIMNALASLEKMLELHHE